MTGRFGSRAATSPRSCGLGLRPRGRWRSGRRGAGDRRPWSSTGASGWSRPRAGPYGTRARRGRCWRRATRRALTGLDGVTVCRLSLPASPIGAFRPAAGAPRAYSAPQVVDLRLARRLPWSSFSDRFDTDVPRFAGLALAVLVVPVLLIRWAMRRGARGLPLLLVLPAVAALLLTAYLIAAPPDAPEISVPRLVAMTVRPCL
jgi:hypothetical protein